jgi:ABC-type transport system involved in cytochrome bd biosynthesis fused ATPase/permease subunit
MQTNFSDSLDEATEDAVQKVLERVFEAQTVISVTHHFRHILWFDRVVVMNQGKVEEIGSPGELLGRPSAFRALYLSERTSTA